jgi:hypothetical protein
MKPTPIGRFVATPSYEELQEEVARLRLTDVEREAVREAVDAYNDNDNDDDEDCAKIAATLWRLLERTK